MTAFVVRTSSGDKWGVLEPQVIGPFDNDEAAGAWIDAHPWLWEADPWYGGYVGVTLVSATNAQSPADAHAEQEEWEESQREDEVTAP